MMHQDNNLLQQQKELLQKHKLTRTEIDLCISCFFKPVIPFEIENIDIDPLFKQLVKYNLEDIYNYETLMDIATNIPTPDASGIFNSIYSWIAPNGDYYSTDFSAHEKKASVIIRGNKGLLYSYIKLFSSPDVAFSVLGTMSSINGEKPIPSNYLESKGWCRFTSSQFECPRPVMDDIHELTEKQLDTIYAVVMQYKLQIDPITGKKIVWDKSRIG